MFVKRDLKDATLIQKIEMWLLDILMTLLLRFEIRGLENIPATGPLVIIFNHIAFLDPVMVMGGMRRLTVPIAKREAFDLFLFGRIMKIYGVIPVSRGETDLAAVKASLGILKKGGALIIAPEGTRSRTYQMQPAKDGAAVLALRTGAAVIPVGITGTHRISAHWRQFKRAPVNLLVGKPFYLRAVSTDGRVARAEMAAMMDEAMYRVAALLPADFRGVYSDLEAATERYLVPLEHEELTQSGG